LEGNRGEGKVKKEKTLMDVSHTVEINLLQRKGNPKKDAQEISRGKFLWGIP